MWGLEAASPTKRAIMFTGFRALRAELSPCTQFGGSAWHVIRGLGFRVLRIVVIQNWGS